MKTAIWAVTACLTTALLSACGGSSNTGTGIVVNLIQTDQQVWRKTTTFTVTGQGLSQGVTISSTACTNVKATSTSSDIQQTFTCKLIGVGSQQINVVTTNGAVNVGSSTIYVPLLTQPQVTMATNMGNIIVQLAPQNAPITVDNFLDYVESGFYANTIFHRVMPTGLSVIQGGGYYQDFSTPPNLLAPIVLETTNMTNAANTIAMARTSVLNSATSQFFFNVAANPGLDTAGNNYAVFGNVFDSASQGVMAAIAAVQTHSVTVSGTQYDNVPLTPVIIKSVTRTQ